MKTFIYKNTYKKVSYGVDVTQRVYRMKNNKPIFLGEHTYNTGSMRGHEHECLAWLYKNKHVPKSYTDGSRTVYCNYEKRGKEFQIYSV